MPQTALQRPWPRARTWMAVPVLAMLLPAQVSAQGAVAELDTVAGPAFPAGTPISVQAEEFTDVNTRLQNVIEKALVARGYTVQSNAAFILSYDTEMSAQTDAEPRGFRDSGAIEAEREEVDTPPWDDGGGELGRALPDAFDAGDATIPLGDPAATTDNPYSLSFTLGQEGAPAIWQGSVTAALPGQDPFEAAEAMVPVLADHIGKTVRDQKVSLEHVPAD